MKLKLVSIVFFYMLLIFGNTSVALSQTKEREKNEFQDVTTDSGIKFRHTIAHFDKRLKNVMPWITAGGAGVAIGDFNNDGLDDIYFTSSGENTMNHLYRNEGNFKFVEVAKTAGLADVNRNETGTSAFALWFDYDNDDWQDLLLLRFGKTSLFRNMANGTFKEVTRKAGILRQMNALAALAFDYDRDGDLDLYIGGYFPEKNMHDMLDSKILFESWETARNGGRNVLFRNNGNGTFIDVTEVVGLQDTGWAMAVGHGDFNNDGWQDIYIANDFGTDMIFKNLGDGTFENITKKSIGFDTKKGMNVDFADYNNDGYLDIYVTNLTAPYLHECNMLWKNNQDETFTDVSVETGSCDTGWGWGAKFLDLDNDGYLDIYVANGFISAGKKDYMEKLLEFVFEEDIDLTDASSWPSMEDYSMGGYQKNVLLHQTLNGFQSIGQEANVDDIHDARGVATADFDNDGRVDIVVSNVNSPPLIYRNISVNDHNWVQFRVEGQDKKSNSSAIGARVEIRAGSVTQIREVAGGNGFEAQSSLRLHFGLGIARRIDHTKITWPDGMIQEFQNLEMNRIYFLKQSETPVAGALGQMGDGGQSTSSKNKNDTSLSDEKISIANKKEPSKVDLSQVESFQPYFTDVSKKANAAVRHHPPVFDSKLDHIMEMVAAGAAGAAIGDYNGDGWEDIFINDPHPGKPNYLLKNNGGMNFTNVAHEAGVANLNDKNQVSTTGLFFDYDGDGWQDLLVVRLGQSLLFKNQQNDTFVDVTKQAGINKRANSLSAIAFDYNGDGFLDIYFGNYFRDINMFQLNTDKVLHDSWETSRNGGANVFYHNNGNGTFTEKTKEVGLEDTGWTMAIAHGDYDNDGWQDIYIANDYGPDKLFRNTGKGSFEDVTDRAIGVDTKKGMNAEFGDFDNDGDLDIFVTNVTEKFLYECNMFWLNNGNGTFTDVSEELNTCDTGWGWGGKFFDYDNDGYLDLYVANGFFKGQGKGNYLDILLPALWETGENPSNPAVWPPLNGMGIAGLEKNQLFTNVQGKTFVREEKGGVDVPKDSRGVYTVDFNNDGLVDLFVTNQDDETILFQNQVRNDNHWAIIDLVGKSPNTDAVGARIKIKIGRKTMMREVNSGNGFAGGSSKRQHFGLGKYSEIEEMYIRWPNGEEQSFRSIKADRIIRVKQGQRTILPDGSTAILSGASTTPAFKDVTKSAGTGHLHHGPVVDERLRNLGPWFTALGAGGAVGDYNNDGYEDIYVTNSVKGQNNILYRNNGDFTFTDVAIQAGVATLNDEHNFSMTALFFDFDNDGWKDLVVARSGLSLIFKNKRDGTFEDITHLVKMPSPRNPVALVAFDYDRDGDLDLYFGCYFPDVDLTDLSSSKSSTNILHESWETARNGGSNFLLENQGGGRFVDKTAVANLSDTGWTLAIGTGDFDKNGFPDIYVANDFGTDKIYRNNGNGTFVDYSLQAIGTDTKKGMNVDIGDYDNDGWLDIYVTNITEPFLQECNMLWRNNGDFTFTDVSAPTGTCDTDWGWGAKFIDYDNNGLLDLYVLNGFISAGEKDYIDILMPIMLDSDDMLSNTMNWPPLNDMSFSGYESNVLFRNEGGHSFIDVAKENGVNSNSDGRGLMIADFDNDGAQDMYVLNANQEAIMYRNLIGSENNWIEIRLQGKKSNRDGIGTRLTFYSTQGLRYRETNAGNGFEGQSTSFVHAGFEALEKVEKIIVEWPSGKTQEFKDVKTRAGYLLVEDEPLKMISISEKNATISKAVK